MLRVWCPAWGFVTKASADNTAFLLSFVWRLMAAHCQDLVVLSDFQPWSSRGVHELTTEMLQENGYDLDSFTSDSYRCVGSCHFLFLNLKI